MKLKIREADALDPEDLEALEEFWAERYEEEYLKK
jgi:hypothetical protein